MTSTALAPKPAVTALAQPRTFAEALEVAKVLARSELVPRALQNRPEAIVLVGAMGAELDVSFVNALSMIDVIEGRPTPSAQLLLAVIRRNGHEARFALTNDERAVLRARRKEYRDDPDGWVEVEFTATQAETAGYLDEWVERKYRQEGDRYDRKERFALKVDGNDYVPAALGAEMPDWVTKEIRAGRVKRLDPWHKRRANMLRARAATDMFRMEFSDLRMGGPLPTFDVDALGPQVSPIGDTFPARGEAVGVPHGGQIPDQGDVVETEIVQEPARQRPAQPDPKPRSLAEQIAMQAQLAGVDRAHVIAAVTGGAKTSAREVDNREGTRVLRAIADLGAGYLELAEVDGTWVLNEAQPAG